MTDLRTAAQQALEALKGYRRELGDRQPCDAEQALEAALAEPVQEPVAKCIDDICSEHLGRVEALDHLPRGTILYTAPPQRLPLTEEEIDGICRQAHGGADPQEWSRNFARAVERAHGIGGEG